MPRSPLRFRDNLYTREYALFALGRFVSQAGGEQAPNETIGPSTASESAKSQALMRCCKDLGIASELWDPTFILKWKKEFAVQEFCEHAKTGKKVALWHRKDRDIQYPYKRLSSGYSSSDSSTTSSSQTTVQKKPPMTTPTTTTKK